MGPVVVAGDGEAPGERQRRLIMIVLMKPAVVLGFLAMYALSSIGGVGMGRQVTFFETNQAIVFQMQSDRGDAQVTVNKDGKKGKIKIEPKKSFRVTYKRGEFDLEVTGEMDDAQMAYTEEVVC